MKLYIVRHGKAKREEEDPSRPLTEKGLKDAEKVARYLSNIKVEKIFHSGKLRAKQTAEVYGKYLKEEVLETDGLGPLDDVKTWAERLKNMDEDVMIVGHLPHLSKLVSTLIVGDEDRDIIKFKTTGTVCLERKQGWRILWAIAPKLY